MLSFVTIGLLLVGLLLIILVIRISEVSAHMMQMEERVNDRVTHIDLEERLRQERRGMDELSPDHIMKTAISG